MLTFAIIVNSNLKDRGLFLLLRLRWQKYWGTWAIKPELLVNGVSEDRDQKGIPSCRDLIVSLVTIVSVTLIAITLTICGIMTRELYWIIILRFRAMQDLLKGQILRLRSHGPPFRTSIGWGFNYATTKPDGLVWIGTTEENAGFDATPTVEARESILRSAVAVLPYLANAQLVQHTACLRPVAPDGLPILGQIPGKRGIVAATAAGRKGILLGPVIGRMAASLVTRGETDMDISAMSPERFIETATRAGAS